MALYTTEVARILAQGTIPASGGTAYVVGSGTAAIVTRMGIANGGTADIAFKFYLGGTTSSFQQPAPGTIVAGGNAEWTGAMPVAGTSYIFYTGAGLIYTVNGTELST